MKKPTYLKIINKKLDNCVSFVDNTKDELTEDEFFCILSWIDQFNKGEVRVSLAYVSSKKCLDFSFVKPVNDGKGLELYLIDRKITKKEKLSSDFAIYGKP